MTTTAVAPSPAPDDLLPEGAAAAAHAAAAWHERSLELARAGQAWAAVETQWASDVATLHVLLWESGLAAVDDPAVQLDAVAGVVQQALAQAGAAPVAAVAVLAWARDAVTAAFGSPVDGLLAARLAPLDHLAALAPVDSRGLRSGRTPAELARELRVVADDCGAVARAMDAAGLTADAEDQRRRAFLATFEAFLVRGAHAAGPTGSAQVVDLRWELAMARASQPDPAGPLSPTELAELLVASVPEAGRPALRAELEALR